MTSRDSVAGVWRLVSADLVDEQGHATYPFGRDPIGMMILTPDGYLSKQFGKAQRPSLPVGDWIAATPAEVNACARDYFAYCGRYEVRGNELIYELELSLMPNWMGGSQTRTFTLENDLLTTTTPVLPIGGQPQTSTLVWRRAASEA